MSININLVSNKPEFNNFFSEQIVLPSNAEATMVKANMDISVLQTTSVRVPYIAADPGVRAETACYVTIDGIVHSITWDDIYNAHTALAATDIDAGITSDEYYSGFYEYLPNNKIFALDNGTGEPKTKLDFPRVFAYAIANEFEFYDTSIQLNKSITDITSQFSENFESKNFISDQGYIQNNILNSYTISSNYAPEKLLDNPLLIKNIDAASLIGWTQSLAAVENVGGTVCQAWFNDNGIDLNGGWYEFRATTVVGGRMATGFVFEGTGLGAAGDNFQPTAVYEPQVIDVGIEFETDAAGVGLYRIINGQSHNTFSHGGGITDVVTPIYKPANAKHIFQDTDNFYLQIQRGNLYNGSNEFIVNIYQGQPGLGITNANVRKIFTSSHNLRSPAIIPNIGFMDNGTLGDKFEAIKYIARTADTGQQANWKDVNTSTSSLFGTIIIDPIVVETSGDGKLIRDFWSAWGLYTDDIDGSDGNVYKSQDSQNQTIQITRPTVYTNQNSSQRYFLGNVLLEEIYIMDPTNGNAIIVNIANPDALINLPKELKVAINNLPVKSYQGSFVTGLRQGNIGSTSGGQARVVGTIPLPQIDENSTNMVITYEPYNLTYKPLNNPEPFMVNQLLVEIFFQDYDTNQRKKFGTVNGHLTLDLNIRQGAKPPPVVNNLRAI